MDRGYLDSPHRSKSSSRRTSGAGFLDEEFMSPPCFESETSTDVPARLERLPWGSFHTLVVIALGVTWIIDGLEVTLAGALSGAFKQSPTLRFTNTDVGFASSAYLAGAVLGALFFGWLTDRWGRKK